MRRSTLIEFILLSSDVVFSNQAHGMHITWLVVFRCDDPSFVPEHRFRVTQSQRCHNFAWALDDVYLLDLPFMVKVELVSIDVSHSPSETVQYGSTSTKIPLKMDCEEFFSFGLDVV